MGQYRREKWKITRKCSNQWVNTVQLYVSLDCRAWQVEKLAFDTFILTNPCSQCRMPKWPNAQKPRSGGAKFEIVAFLFTVVSDDSPPGGQPLGPIYRMNADHLEFCSSQTWFCPMRWLANPPSRADNPLWKPKTANQQWCQRLIILANILKYPAKTYLGLWHIIAPSHGSSTTSGTQRMAVSSNRGS